MKLRPRFSLLGMILVAMIVALVISNLSTSFKLHHVTELLYTAKADENPIASKVDYDKYLVFRRDGDVYALHLSRNARRDAGVFYHWFKLADSSRESWPDLKRQQGYTKRDESFSSGSGEAWEPLSYNLQVDDLKIEWSAGGQVSGWIYWQPAGSFEVFPIQFDRLEDFQGKLEKPVWMPIP